VTPALSIIVPVLNEAASLPSLLAHLQAFRDGGCEVIVVDGGSDDGSAALVREGGFDCLMAPQGRAAQMNAGAAQARGDVLLFLHADTTLPQAAAQLIHDALARSGSGWGRFDLRIEGKSRMLPVVAWAINHRSRWTGIATGDQALFVRRSLFLTIGQFPQLPLMEDLELCRRLRRICHPACIDTKVTTSGRRWDLQGAGPTILLMWGLRLAYWSGVPAKRLARHYR
jgi:rSAM/selenodomain-associated transferase 2